MDKREFLRIVTEQEALRDYNVKAIVKKLEDGTEHVGATASRDGVDIGSFSFDAYYDYVVNGSYDMELAKMTVKFMIKLQYLFKSGWIYKWENVKGHLILLSNSGEDTEDAGNLMEIPHRTLNGKEVIYGLTLPDENDDGSITVTDADLVRWSVSEDDLYEAAVSNAIAKTA